MDAMLADDAALFRARGCADGAAPLTDLLSPAYRATYSTGGNTLVLVNIMIFRKVRFALLYLQHFTTIYKNIWVFTAVPAFAGKTRLRQRTADCQDAEARWLWRAPGECQHTTEDTTEARTALRASVTQMYASALTLTTGWSNYDIVGCLFALGELSPKSVRIPVAGTRGAGSVEHGAGRGMSVRAEQTVAGIPPAGYAAAPAAWHMHARGAGGRVAAFKHSPATEAARRGLALVERAARRRQGRPRAGGARGGGSE